MKQHTQVRLSVALSVFGAILAFVGVHLYGGWGGLAAVAVMPFIGYGAARWAFQRQTKDGGR